MKHLLYVIILLIVLVIFFLRTCSSFVEGIDGDKAPKMIHLANNYYFDEIEKGIWEYEKKTDAYLICVAGKIDSLSYDDNYIVCYANQKYIFINSSTGKIEKLDNIKNKIDLIGGPIKNINEVNSLINL